MESPRKNNDCYFYYYSTCTKGDSCSFRHEPTALGCETVCSFWQQGKCLNQHCNFRHMELRKNRKAIPCYWETQPGGCLKPHCPFQHKTPKESGGVDSAGELSDAGTQPKTQDRPEWNRRPDTNQYESELESGECAKPNLRRVSQGSEASYGSPAVDPLVVNFEEESDSESVPTSSPSKQMYQHNRAVQVKTLEEIRLERVQAESAAYYSYPNPEEILAASSNNATADLENRAQDLRSRIINRLGGRPKNSDFKILSLDEIRKRKQYDEDPEPNRKMRKIEQIKLNDENEEVKIKTLAEIRATKMNKENKRSLSPDCEENSIKKSATETVSSTEVSDMCVSSSSTIRPFRKTKRKLSTIDRNCVRLKPKLIRPKIIRNDDNVVESTENIENNDSSTSRMPDLVADCNRVEENVSGVKLKDAPAKLDEESLLLVGDSDDENSSFCLTAADDILQNIDDILND